MQYVWGHVALGNILIRNTRGTIGCADIIAIICHQSQDDALLHESSIPTNFTQILNAPLIAARALSHLQQRLLWMTRFVSTTIDGGRLMSPSPMLYQICGG